MKPGAILVNTARGPVLDERARRRGAARADSSAAPGWTCSRRSPCPRSSPLRQLDNVIFTDHAGWYSEESVVELKTKAARNAAAVLAGRPSAVSRQRGGHRIDGARRGIVTFGEIMLRLKPPGAERFFQSPLFEATFGGGEANVAAALARFGCDAAFVSVDPRERNR